MSEVISFPLPAPSFDHDRLKLEVLLASLKGELAAALNVRPIEDIQADIDDVRRQLEAHR